MYADRKEKDVDPKKSTNVLDRWILARLVELEGEVGRGFDVYEIDRATRPIGDFVDDLSTWYLRRSRDRFKGDDVNDRDMALAATQYVFAEFSKVIAPVMPFVADFVYKKAGGEKESVHLETWPKTEVITDSEDALLAQMTTVRQVCSLVLQKRSEAGIKVRQPLSGLKISATMILPGEYRDDLLAIIADEVNVKNVVFDDIDDDIELDTTLTPELLKEGNFRELVRNIQELRKETRLTPDDKVVARIETENTGKEFVETFKDELMKASLLKDVVFEDVAEGKEFKVEDMNFKVSFVK
jgi:isoleucyl-tRNA synthetase